MSRLLYRCTFSLLAVVVAVSGYAPVAHAWRLTDEAQAETFIQASFEPGIDVVGLYGREGTVDINRIRNVVREIAPKNGFRLAQDENSDDLHIKVDYYEGPSYALLSVDYRHIVSVVLVRRQSDLTDYSVIAHDLNTALRQLGLHPDFPYTPEVTDTKP